jgi:hypothetical protein
MSTSSILEEPTTIILVPISEEIRLSSIISTLTDIEDEKN